MCLSIFSPASIQKSTVDFESGLKKKYCGFTITQQSAVVSKHFMAVAESLKLKSSFLDYCYWIDCVRINGIEY